MSSRFIDTITCPITKDFMYDPVIDLDGISYERDAILTWLTMNSTSPVTRHPLTSQNLAPNRALKSLIQYILPAIIESREPAVGEVAGVVIICSTLDDFDYLKDEMVWKHRKEVAFRNLLTNWHSTESAFISKGSWGPLSRGVLCFLFANFLRRMIIDRYLRCHENEISGLDGKERDLFKGRLEMYFHLSQMEIVSFSPIEEIYLHRFERTVLLLLYIAPDIDREVAFTIGTLFEGARIEEPVKESLFRYAIIDCLVHTLKEQKFDDSLKATLSCRTNSSEDYRSPAMKKMRAHHSSRSFSDEFTLREAAGGSRSDQSCKSFPFASIVSDVGTPIDGVAPTNDWDECPSRLFTDSYSASLETPKISSSSSTDREDLVEAVKVPSCRATSKRAFQTPNVNTSSTTANSSSHELRLKKLLRTYWTNLIPDYLSHTDELLPSSALHLFSDEN